MASELSTCCCCFKLRTGCFIIGYMGAIGSVLLMILSIAGLIITGLRDNVLKGYDKHVNNVMMWVCVAVLVLGVFFLAIDVILLVGLHENRPRLVMVYLICTTGYLTITFVLSLVVTVFDIFFGIRCLISFVCSVYYMIVVRSYHSQMTESLEKQPTKPV